jgi:hypothetical protein
MNDLMDIRHKKQGKNLFNCAKGFLAPALNLSKIKQ